MNGTPQFEQHVAVTNGFSNVMCDVFGDETGIGARSAIGQGSLPCPGGWNGRLEYFMASVDPPGQFQSQINKQAGKSTWRRGCGVAYFTRGRSLLAWMSLCSQAWNLITRVGNEL